MKRRVVVVVVILAIVGCALAIFHRPLAVAYHQWRMNAAYNSIFSGEPKPMGNGLAAWDVKAGDVDAALDAYSHHRQRLVELGAFCHVKGSLPHLISDGSTAQSEARSEFTRRLWDRFPGHCRYRHYYLAGDGSFEAWVPIAAQSAWEDFVRMESSGGLDTFPQ